MAVVNSVAGLAIAWVLVRDDFRGKALVGAVIDLPFALPTIVAGLTLLALYGPNSPFHVNLAGTRLGIACALAFVTLPFCVRSVQPVLAELDAETEEAAASLGASRRQVLRRIILPSVLPSVLAGAGLAFARAVGEFGSVVLISGNIPFKTEVASSWIYSLSQSDDLPGGQRGLRRARRHRARSCSSASAGPAAASRSHRDGVKRSRWRLPLRFAVLGYLALLVILPVGTVFYRAFQHGLGAAWDAITAPDALHALWLTLLVAAIAVPLNTVFGVGVSLILARHRFPGAWLLDALVDIPLAISPVVIGLSLILVYGHTGWFGNWLAARAHHGHLLGARHRHGLGRRLAALRRARGAAGAPGDRHRAGAGGPHPRRRPAHGLPADHPAQHPPRPGLRRDPHHGPRARRVRRRGHRLGRHRRQDPDADPVHLRPASTTSTPRAPTSARWPCASPPSSCLRL